MSKTWVSIRFASPTQSFDLDVLVGRLRKGFALSVGIAAALHLVIAGINPFEEAKKKAPRPLTTKFIKREPRLTKPLELRKIPSPSGRWPGARCSWPRPGWTRSRPRPVSTPAA